MKKIYPKEGKVILSHDLFVRVGKHVIGWWDKERVESSPHFRPSPAEGCVSYYAKLNNDEFVQSFSWHDLHDEIVAACQDGIEPVED